MKYTIHGFQQKVAKDLELTNDDLLILRWFVDFKETGDMERKYLSQINNMGYWVSYEHLINQLPIIFSAKTKRGNIDRLQRILKGNLSKVLVRDISRKKDQRGSKVFLYLNSEVYRTLLKKDNDNHHAKMRCDSKTTTQKCVVTTTQKCVIPPRKNAWSDTSIIDTSINNTNTTQFNACSSENGLKNKLLIEKKTHLKITKNQSKIISNWDNSRLNISIGIFLSMGGKYFSLLDKIYRDDGNFVPKSDGITDSKGKDLKFNNFEAREYDYDSLEKKLLGWDE